ncbi:hypothetical protein [Rhodoferax sp. GW822-FHT02A01]|uniref:tyrosine-type recombinase/integrase n=1 Tax=Rhodoferax sp. GW822-FHT02A01 TaxID=3141537 RepID=UPI00315DB7E1
MFEETKSSPISTTEFLASNSGRMNPAKLKHQKDSTTTAYAKDVQQFVNYGGTIPSSPEDVIGYIRLLERRVAPATAVRRLMAIQDEHLKRGLNSPTADPRVRAAMRFLAKGLPPHNLLDGDAKTPVQKRPEGKRGAAPITRPLMLRMLDAMGTGRRSLDRRDTALLLLGFIGGLKRGAICALNLEDVSFSEDAMLLRMGSGRDSEDKESRRTIAIPFTRGPLCAATAVQVWIAHNALEGCTGPLFPRFTRSGEPLLTDRLDAAYVSQVVKRRLKDAGIEDVSRFSGESLRLGHAQETNVRRRS